MGNAAGSIFAASISGSAYLNDLPLSKDVDTYYEKETISYPASYVSLLYPSAMMGESQVTGDVPDPPWVIPASARQSRLKRLKGKVPALGMGLSEKLPDQDAACVRKTPVAPFAIYSRIRRWVHWLLKVLKPK